MALWVVRCGGDGSFEQDALSENIVGIGWGKLGDLSKISTREEVQELYARTHPDESVKSQQNQVAQVFAFRSRIAKGDLVALPLKNSPSIAIGIIKGEYKFADAENGAKSTMTSILGRMATYSGQMVYWDKAINSGLDIHPKVYAWDATPPVVPNADGSYPIAIPGVTKY